MVEFIKQAMQIMRLVAFRLVTFLFIPFLTRLAFVVTVMCFVLLAPRPIVELYRTGQITYCPSDVTLERILILIKYSPIIGQICVFDRMLRLVLRRVNECASSEALFSLMIGSVVPCGLAYASVCAATSYWLSSFDWLWSQVTFGDIDLAWLEFVALLFMPSAFAAFAYEEIKRHKNYANPVPASKV
jgi:hypothetical protein